MRESPLSRDVRAYDYPYDQRRPGVALVVVDARYLAALECIAAAARAWARCATTTGLIAADLRLREALAALPPAGEEGHDGG